VQIARNLTLFELDYMDLIVVKRRVLTPQSQAFSICYTADRRPNPAPINRSACLLPKRPTRALAAKSIWIFLRRTMSIASLVQHLLRFFISTGGGPLQPIPSEFLVHPEPVSFVVHEPEIGFCQDVAVAKSPMQPFETL